MYVDANEVWDIIDKQKNVVGQMLRGRDKVPAGFYHLTVEVIATDGNGHMLVTQREWSKLRDSGKMEFPAGAVISGETAEQAARRELWEETGLVADQLFVLHESTVTGVIRIAYVAYIPDLLERKITLQPDETIAYRFITWDEWLTIVGSGEWEFGYQRHYTTAFMRNLKMILGEKKEEWEKLLAENNASVPLRRVSIRRSSERAKKV